MGNKRRNHGNQSWKSTMLLGIALMLLAATVWDEGDATPANMIRLPAILESTVEKPDIRPGAKEITARFTYHFNGQRFQSDRQGVQDPEVDPNLLFWRTDSGSIPLANLHSGEHFYLWINPLHPEQPFLNPSSLSPWAVERDFLFRLFLFLGFPLFLLGSAQTLMVRSHPLSIRSHRAFRWNPSWLAAGIAGSFLCLPLYAGWSATLDPVATGWFIQWGMGESLAGALLLFFMVGLYAVKRWWSRHILPLTCTTRLRTGSAFGGFVTLEQPIESTSEFFTFTLSCITTEGGVTGDRVTLWSEIQQVPLATGARLTFRYMVPAKLPGSSRRVTWRLDLAGRLNDQTIEKKFLLDMSGIPLEVLEREMQPEQ